ncbi:hypothetical protein D3C75_971890 [compost metagenome]
MTFPGLPLYSPSVISYRYPIATNRFLGYLDRLVGQEQASQGKEWHTRLPPLGQKSSHRVSFLRLQRLQGYISLQATVLLGLFVTSPEIVRGYRGYKPCLACPSSG